MSTKGRGAIALTGGAAGALDSIDGAVLEDGDVSVVGSSTAVFYPYRVNATSGAAESSPAIIAPDTNPGTKRHILMGARFASLQLPAGATIVEFSTDGTFGDNADTVLPTEKAVKTYVDTEVAAATGKIIQTVYAEIATAPTGSTVVPFDDTIPQNTEGDEYITKAITPTNAANKLKIEVCVHAATSNAAGVHKIAALFQDATADAIAFGVIIGLQNYLDTISFVHIMDAGGVAEITFKVRVGASGAGTTTINGSAGARIGGGVLKSSLIITEYTP